MFSPASTFFFIKSGKDTGGKTSSDIRPLPFGYSIFVTLPSASFVSTASSGTLFANPLNIISL